MLQEQNRGGDHERLDAILAECARAWADGESIDIAALCAQHADLPELRARIEDLRFVLEGLRGTAPEPAPQRAPAAIGPYRIASVLGEGGMGVVYRAEQKEPVSREVAVKVLRAGLPTERMVTRFRAESQALARMEHAAIARVFDAGTTDDHLPFVVMELVHGEPITTWCARSDASIPLVLELFARVCDGVQHAHQKGVIHRDLKPSNVLVTESSGQPEPKIIDFGLACAVDPSEGAFAPSSSGSFVGTPEYMSPEQAGIDASDVDTRTDVYALGVILYELVAEALPTPARSFRTTDIAEIQRVIRSTEPAPPSVTLARKVAASPPGAARERLRERRHRVAGDLDCIVQKAIAKDRAFRYETAAQLADDVRRHLTHEPVIARPPSRLYHASRFVRRHRAAVTAAALVTLAIAGGAAAALTQAARAESAVADYRRMRDVPLCQDLLHASEQALWPAVPERLAAMDEWLAAARPLVARIADHRARLAALEGSGGGVADPAELRFQRDAMATLVGLLERLERELPLVEQRRVRASTLAQRSLVDAAAAWTAALAATRANPAYRELPSLEPQLGLVPLGVDPGSGLAEFAMLDTGRAPVRDAAGKLEIAEDTAMVFILVPSGDFDMGAQATDPSAPNHDKLARDDEAPVRRVRLDAFLISKYEMTQGQWTRAFGKNPSHYWAGGRAPDGKRVTLRHPVESVDFHMAVPALTRLGLALPTEAQWERAARGGTSTRWWTGDAKAGLQGAGNVADRACAEHGGPDQLRFERDLDDGFVLHAPVGSFRANPFGLCDVVGNVWEWCLGTEGPYTEDPREGDGYRQGKGTMGILRGGAWSFGALEARSAHRTSDRQGNADAGYGVRPVRPLVLGGRR